MHPVSSLEGSRGKERPLSFYPEEVAYFQSNSDVPWLRKRWQGGARLGFHQRDVGAVETTIHCDIAAEITAANRLAGSGFRLADVG